MAEDPILRGVGGVGPDVVAAVSDLPRAIHIEGINAGHPVEHDDEVVPDVAGRLRAGLGSQQADARAGSPDHGALAANSGKEARIGPAGAGIAFGPETETEYVSIVKTHRVVGGDAIAGGGARAGTAEAQRVAR